MGWWLLLSILAAVSVATYCCLLTDENNEITPLKKRK
jgi:hypothetical protein